ncbi:zinc finger and BTB domain-containing protein 43-like [Lampetra fluviatilis]
MAPDSRTILVDFPHFSEAVLHRLNQQRLEGQLCDLTVGVQGRTFRAHRAVLAASSPYFCDQVLLKSCSRIVLPDVMSARAFEGVLTSCYTGRLSLHPDDMVACLTIASFLQMWHLVDRCTELLNMARATPRPASTSSSSNRRKGQRSSVEQSPSSSNFIGAPENPEVHSAAVGNGEQETNYANEENESKECEMSLNNEAENISSNSSVGQESTEYPFQEELEEVRTDFGEVQGRPPHIPTSIIPQRQWVQVKTEKIEHKLGSPYVNDANLHDENCFSEDGVVEHLLRSSEVGDPFTEPAPGSHEEFDEQLERASYHGHLKDYYGVSSHIYDTEVRMKAHGESQSTVTEGALAADSYQQGGGEAEARPEQAGSAYKLYQCQCGKRFTHKSQRDRHMSMHLGLRPYSCSICGKSFKMKHHLSGHMKTHTGYRPFSCLCCGKKFMWRDSFTRHSTICGQDSQAQANTPLDGP